jgi:hypothetical protein
MGRPSSYNEATGQAICERLANGESLRKICSDAGMPVQSTVFKWIADNEAFAKQYASARETQMEVMAEEILAIADDSTNDTMTVKRGDSEKDVADNEWINRSRLRVDTRKWLMSKMAPKKYGDKVEQFISGPNGGPIQAAITVEFVKTNPNG